MKFRRAFLAFLVTACVLALVGLAPVVRAQYSYQDKVLGIQSANIQAYWTLDETNGTTAEDIASTNDGTYNGPTLAAVDAADPAWLDAPSFDGVNDWVGAPALSLTNSSLTMSAWVRFNVVPVGVVIISVFSGAGGAGEKASLVADGNSKFRLTFGTGSGLSGTTTIQANVWYHVAGTYTSGTDTSVIYVNGVSEGSNAAGPMTQTASGTDLGRDVTGYLNGSLDEVIVWNVPLGGTDIETVADTSGLPTPTPTSTNTPTVTPTLEFGSHIILSSGQVGALYYKIDSGSVLLGLLLLLQIGLLLALLALRMWRRA